MPDSRRRRDMRTLRASAVEGAGEAAAAEAAPETVASPRAPGANARASGGDAHASDSETHVPGPDANVSGLDVLASGPGVLFEPGRVAAFSDGVMAIAITLLVLNLRLPDAVATSDADLLDQLRGLEAPFVAFLLSFAVIAVWWNSHHRLFGALRHGDRRILVLNFLFLAAVVFLPFPTSILGRYTSLATAVVLYAGTNVVIGSAAFLMWWHADRAGLLVTALNPTDLRRLMTLAAIAPAVFVFSIPVALVNPDLAPWSWNVVWIVALALRLAWRRANRPAPG